MKRFNNCEVQNDLVEIKRSEKKPKFSCDHVDPFFVTQTRIVRDSISNDDVDDSKRLALKLRACTSKRQGPSPALILIDCVVNESGSAYRYWKKYNPNAATILKDKSNKNCNGYHDQSDEIKRVNGMIQIDSIALSTNNDKENMGSSQTSRTTSCTIEWSSQGHEKTQLRNLQDKILPITIETVQKNADFWKILLYSSRDQLLDEQRMILIKVAVRNFFPELMLGIQYQRNNTVCIARIVFTAGVHLCNFGLIDKAMLLYDALLDTLLCLSVIGTCNDDSVDLRGQTQQFDHQQPSIVVAARRSLYKESINAFLAVFPRMLTTLEKLGTFHLSINDVDMAMDCFKSGSQVDAAFLQICCCNMIESLINIALIHRRRNDFVLALTKYIQVYFLQCRVFGPQSLEVATSLSLIALMQYRLKQYSSAYEMYYESLSIQLDILGGVNLWVASTVNSLGLCCFYVRSFRRAKTFFLRSLKIRQKLMGCDNYDLAIIWYNLGTICVETGDDLESIRCYNESLRIEELSIDYTKCDGAVLALKNLGYIYQRNGEIDEAAQYFRRALEMQQKKKGAISECVGKVLNVLGNIHLQKGDVANMMDCFIHAARCYKRTNGTMLITGYTFYCLSKLHPQCSNAA
jgi:tetratricopeptide (TPR) repeat protein